MVAPDDVPFFLPTSPTHPDFAHLVESVLWLDGQSSAGHDVEAVCRQVGVEHQALVQAAFQWGDAVAREGGTATLQTRAAAAWKVAFRVGIHTPAAPDHSTASGVLTDAQRIHEGVTRSAASTFVRALDPDGGVDDASVRYVARQRALRLLSSSESLQPTVVFASVWLEGFLAGLKFAAAYPAPSGQRYR